VSLRLMDGKVLLVKSDGAAGDGDGDAWEAEEPWPEPSADVPADARGLKFPEMYFSENVGGRFRPGRYEGFMDGYVEKLLAGEVVGPTGNFAQRFMAGEVRSNAPGKLEVQDAHPRDRAYQECCENYGARRSEVVEALRSFVEPPPWQKMKMTELKKEAPKMLPGEMYRVEIPPTLGELEEMGAPWLTRAFHAAGTLPPDNSVARIVKFKRLPTTTIASAGGAGPKAFMTVEYEKDDPNLHTELFVKMPWAVSGTKEMGADALYRTRISGNSDSEFMECTIYRFMGPIFPFRIPKYYFSDVCRPNTNYILITEKIMFGSSGEYLEGKKRSSFGPHEVLPVAEKYFDFQVEPKQQYEMYYCIMRAQARMAAWDVTGKFDFVPPQLRGGNLIPPLLGTFQWPPKLPAEQRQEKRIPAERFSKLWREYLCEYARRCYAPEYTGDAFVSAIERCCYDARMWDDALQLYNGLFPQWLGMQHTNLQSDNAYFWRDDEGVMDAGIIDWGGASPGYLPSRLTASLTSAEGHVLYEHEEGLLRCLRDEFYRESGIFLDFGELMRQWYLAYVQYVSGMGTNIEMEVFRETKKEEWLDIDSLNHPKVAGRWNVRCYAFMIEHALAYLHLHWKDKSNKKYFHVHDCMREWKAYWIKNDMT